MRNFGKKIILKSKTQGRSNYSSIRHFSLVPKSVTDFKEASKSFREKKGFLIDCDGVLYHGQKLLPGAKSFISFLKQYDYSYLYMTNASYKSPEQLADRLTGLGIEEKPEKFFSAIDSTAKFISNQSPGALCHVLGENSLAAALKREGLKVYDERNGVVEYVVVGETQNDLIYNYSAIDLASRLVLKGAKLIGTNIDVADRIGEHLMAGTGALIKPIEAVTGKEAFFPGKPNPLMARAGLDLIGLHASDCIMVGDRMDTDMQLAVESGLSSILVLSGVTRLKDLEKFSFQPTVILDSVEDIPKLFNST